MGCGGWGDGSLKEGVGKRGKRRMEIFPLVYVSEWRYRCPDKKIIIIIKGPVPIRCIKTFEGPFWSPLNLREFFR